MILPSCNQTGQCQRLAAEHMPEVRYFAGAKAAAGIATEFREERTLAELITATTVQHGPKLGQILRASSFLVDGTVSRDLAREIPSNAVIDVLPPFAGG